MNNIRKMSIKLIAAAQILAITLLAACTAANTPTSVCHATGDPAKPYQEITGTGAELLKAHSGHPNDIYPVPANGCPTSALEPANGKIMICHATSSEKDPYNEIQVSVNGLNGHGKHTGDIIPAPESGCPASTLEIVNGKISICHATGSETNPYNEITISVNGLNGHSGHPNDIYPVPANGCPTSPLEPVNGKITICHATGSEKNPYNEITISINGLNGHDNHAGDIIPAPVGGCPATRQ
jgi:hypothetical protein